MTEYLTYSITGLIVKTGNCPLDMLTLQASGTDTAIQGTANDSLQYIPDINTPIITDKLVNTSSIDKTTITADGVDIATISSIPVGSTVTFTTPIASNPIDPVVVSDGLLEFTSTSYGIYTLDI